MSLESRGSDSAATEEGWRGWAGKAVRSRRPGGAAGTAGLLVQTRDLVILLGPREMPVAAFKVRRKEMNIILMKT